MRILVQGNYGELVQCRRVNERRRRNIQIVASSAVRRYRGIYVCIEWWHCHWWSLSNSAVAISHLPCLVKFIKASGQGSNPQRRDIKQNKKTSQDHDNQWGMIRMYITKCLIPNITIYTTQSANKKPVVTLHILNSLILSRLVDTLNDLHGWIQKALHAIRHTGFVCLVQPCLDFCDALVETDFSVLVYCRLKVGSSLFCFFCFNVSI